MTSTWNNAAVVARVRQALMRGIVVATEGVRNEAVSLVLDTKKTGRIYRRRGVEHQASAPGEPPASDTGTLVSRIRTDYSRLGELVGVVRASTAYAAALEYGTPRMEPRPFMRPALANRRKQIIAGLEAEVRAVL
ncbi:MAG: hypothetical protein Q7T33_02660 [Dehalococcoidia bacterium]|nr:hypothetical protein [Dehalococcoidia bacterium]